MTVAPAQPSRQAQGRGKPQWPHCSGRVAAVNHHRGQIRAQPKETLVGLNQAQVHIRFADDGDRLPCASDAGFVDRVDVILRGKIARRYHEDDPAASDKSLRRGLVGLSVELRLPQHLQARLRLEVVQRSKAGDDRSKRGGNRWIGCVGQMRLAVHQIAVNLSLEGFAHLARGSGELNRHTPA